VWAAVSDAFDARDVRMSSALRRLQHAERRRCESVRALTRRCVDDATKVASVGADSVQRQLQETVLNSNVRATRNNDAGDDAITRLRVADVLKRSEAEKRFQSVVDRQVTPCCVFAFMFVCFYCFFCSLLRPRFLLSALKYSRVLCSHVSHPHRQ
jgi:hypothetical protein